MSDWEKFGVSLFIVLLYPLMPAFFEFLVDLLKSGKVDILPQTYVLTAATYVSSVGLTSRSLLYMLISIAVAAIYSVVYGVVSSGSCLPSYVSTVEWSSLAGIVIVLFVHGFERYRRHIVEDEDIEWAIRF